MQSKIGPTLQGYQKHSVKETCNLHSVKNLIEANIWDPTGPKKVLACVPCPQEAQLGVRKSFFLVLNNTTFSD